ncbi:MAG: uroporphyrinogen-III C-methyltransferase [Rhodanobacteraceae bacterium]|nr:MAG: uroporphyrinogen-III C-methyltransferase [Rhodanobacteraceae bacterium]
MTATPSIDAFAAAPLFPLFADLHGRAVLVVGGGTVARRKVEALLEAGAQVSLGAPEVQPALRQLIERGRLQHRRGEFEPAWLDDAWLVVAASNAAALNRKVADAATARGIFVNVVDDIDASSFHVPARVRRGRLQIAVSSGGAAPVLARRLRERLEAELPESLENLAELFARERARIGRRFPRTGERRRFFERLLDGALPKLLQAGDAEGARAAFERALAAGAPEAKPGSVALVGAGPGDPGLLTLKALRALQDADVILHDRLIGTGILDMARRDAERIDVGKRVGENHDATQARIHALMLHHARASRRVVRLQGGDPLVFGRGGEELEFLRAHGIAYSVIPGITAALGSAAAAGIALTDRRHAHSVTLLAARGSETPDWRALAAPHQTLAVYMGVGELESLSESLIQHGRGADTPCVLVENASLPDERKFAGTLAGLPALARAQGVRAPALLIVGEVAAQAQRALRVERCRGGDVSIAQAA